MIDRGGLALKSEERREEESVCRPFTSARPSGSPNEPDVGRCLPRERDAVTSRDCRRYPLPRRRPRASPPGRGGALRRKGGRRGRLEAVAGAVPPPVREGRRAGVGVVLVLKAGGSFCPCRDADGERAPLSHRCGGDGFVLDGRLGPLGLLRRPEGGDPRPRSPGRRVREERPRRGAARGGGPGRSGPGRCRPPASGGRGRQRGGWQVLLPPVPPELLRRAGAGRPCDKRGDLLDGPGARINEHGPAVGRRRGRVRRRRERRWQDDGRRGPRRPSPRGGGPRRAAVPHDGGAIEHPGREGPGRRPRGDDAAGPEGAPRGVPPEPDLHVARRQHDTEGAVPRGRRVKAGDGGLAVRRRTVRVRIRLQGPVPRGRAVLLGTDPRGRGRRHRRGTISVRGSVVFGTDLGTDVRPEPVGTFLMIETRGTPEPSPDKVAWGCYKHKNKIFVPEAGPLGLRPRADGWNCSLGGGPGRRVRRVPFSREKTASPRSRQRSPTSSAREAFEAMKNTCGSEVDSSLS
ncbi:hypothetical protein THAOC_23686 [Thalassiosira oceanica]|uniref:Uncharacterized protein n=1 Tax=Thalassiosira oceanica TaxID=159749 RepID=K0RTS6_THAOC|nr:hypothetical protein THAOC_23686 [Thalassiosira oceanica]|eukprot:EJK56425.1 hypothetical protein THAOC_23686 [Thalassiosira oceanica]